MAGVEVAQLVKELEAVVVDGVEHSTGPAVEVESELEYGVESA